MKPLIILVMVGFIAGCATRGDPRLSGTFISDKATTMAYLESTGYYKPEKLELLRPMFGKLVVTYNGLLATTIMDGYTETNTFSIVDSGPTHVVIKSEMGWKELIGEAIILTNRLEFTDDGYWVMDADRSHPFKEKFIRK